MVICREALEKWKPNYRKNDFQKLKGTIAAHDKQSLLNAVSNAILIYKDLRRELFDPTIIFHHQAEKRVMEFYEKT